MPYLVVPGSFSPKCSKFVTGPEPQNVHSISYCKCNFNCEFCFFKFYKDINHYAEFSADKFKQLVIDLMARGSTFKFTGGEPTLNPLLSRDLAIAKSLGCTTFLDTNGSSPVNIKKLIEKNLVDLFGISLKGLSAEEAIKRSGVKNRKLCWDNVLESIDFISNQSSCDVIVTYVCYEDFSLENLKQFADILSRFENVYLKINNYQPNVEHPTPMLKPMPTAKLYDLIKVFIDGAPVWQGRVTLINGPQAVENFSEVVLF